MFDSSTISKILATLENPEKHWKSLAPWNSVIGGSPGSKIWEEMEDRNKNNRYWKFCVIGTIAEDKRSFVQNLSPVLFREEFEGQKAVTHLKACYDTYDWLNLYAVPGGRRFDFIWEALAEDSIGLVLVLDPTKAEVFHDSWAMLHTFLSYGEVPYAVAVKTVGSETFSIADIRQIFRLAGCRRTPQARMSSKLWG